MLARLAVWILTTAVMLGLASGVMTSRSVEAEDLAAKREEDSIVLVAAEDDDGDDTNGGTNTTSNDGNTDKSGKSNDGTNSRFTSVSRDRDRSRGDLTKDFTKDGPGGWTRDHSKNHTNDRSRNDTR